MAQRIPDSLIDEILASAKKYNLETGETVTDTPAATPVEEVAVEPAQEIEIEEVTEAIEEIEEVAEIEEIEEEPKQAPKKKRFSLSFSSLMSSVDEDDEEEDEYEDIGSSEVSLLAMENGQIGLATDGEEIGVEETEPEVEEEVLDTPKLEIKPASSQISIEKTRMFNEVKIHGEYNPNIAHNLGNKVVHTTTEETEPISSSAFDEEKYRRHFMNKPVQNLEKTQEHRAFIEGLPQKTIETPGVVIKNKSASADTDGFQPLPTLIPAEYELEKERNISSNTEEDFEDNQFVLEGFVDGDDDIIQQSEEEAEAELREARKEKVDNFVKDGLLFKQDVEETEHKSRYDRKKVSVAREYFGPKDALAVAKIFESEKATLTIKTIALAIIGFTMAILTSVASSNNGDFEIYGNNEFVYVFIQGFLLLVACLLNIKSFSGAIKSLKNKVFDIDSVIVVTVIAGFLQCFVGAIHTDNVESVAHMLTAAAIMPMLLKNIGDLIRNKTDYNNFLILTDEDNDLYGVCNIADEEVADEIARGLMIAEPEIKYSGKAKFYSRFVELSRLAEVNGPLIKIVLPAVMVIAVVAGVVYGIIEENIFAGVTSFTGVILMGLPVAASLLSAVNLSATNKLLNKENTFINGYSTVEDAVNSNGVVIDACDAFVSGGCNIEGMKLYHKMRIDEAIQYTASVIIASGGVLSDVFSNVLIGKQELLFPVETLAYEEKLGCSCWIHNHRVLVGNRELLVHHNVEVPDRELEEKFKSNGRNVIYLAIEGKISAMFVVVYKANELTARYMRELEKDGLTIFFRTSDANITEQFIDSEFGLPSNVVKIINPVAGDMFTKTKKEEVERIDAKIIHNGSVKTMLSALHNAFVIHSFVNMSRIIQVVASFIGVAIVIMLSFMSDIADVGVWQIILYQVIWTTVLSLLPKLRKK